MNNFPQSPQETELPAPKTSGKLYQTSTSIQPQSETITILEPKVSTHKTSTTLQFAEEKHQYLREYINTADQKAIFFFTINSSLLAFLNTKYPSSYWLKWPTLDLVVFLAIMLSLTVSAILFLSIVTPRLKGSKRGLIFFSAIAEYATKEEYIDAIQKLSEADILTEKLQHCYELAKICHIKYCIFVWGQWIFAISIFFSFVFSLIK